MSITAHDLDAPLRDVPVISPGPLVPPAGFGPVDRLEGWAATAVVAALAALTRFMSLGSPTDAGTPIFDEKHYAPQAWQLLHNYGVEDNPGFGLVVHPPAGKQLIAFGEALFGYTGVGWRFTAAVFGVLRGRRYTSQWLSMLSLLYLTEGVLRASDPGLTGVFALIEVALSVALFTSTMLHARATAPSRAQ